jgi:UDP-2-acetamido-2,6-beta-L-arabino-hexul-4-ose reductase
MMRIAITGAAGLIGWHVHAWLRVQPGLQVIPVGRDAWQTPERLAAALAGADAIVHLAAMNRGAEAEVEETNLRLAAVLTDALRLAGSTPHLLHASSTQVDRDTAYGRSKRQAAAILAGWASASGAAFTDMILPNVFGEGGRPFHNSVVATFCRQLADGTPRRIDVDAEICFLHAHRVARGIADIVIAGDTGIWRPEGRRLTVSSLLERLEQFDRSYRHDRLIPDLRDPFDLDLFNTYRSYLFPRHYPVAFRRHTDQRGTLIEAIRETSGGQIHYSTTHPGFVRGQHYHFRKVERFVVLAGEAEVAVRPVCSREIHRFRLSGDEPAFIDMPTMHVHNLANVGSGELVAMFWTNDLYDPAAPDTYPEAVDLPDGAAAAMAASQ